MVGQWYIECITYKLFLYSNLILVPLTYNLNPFGKFLYKQFFCGRVLKLELLKWA